MDIEQIMVGIGVGLYVASSLLAIIALVTDRPNKERAAIVLMLAGTLILTGVLLARGIWTTAIPAFNRFESMTSYALALSAVYLLWTAFRRTRGLAGLLVPYATALLLCGVSTMSVTSGTPVPIAGPWVTLHTLTAFAAYGFFTLASACAAAYLMQDNNLKHKRLGAVWKHLPSLEALDHTMSRSAGLAFLLLSVSVALGFVLIRRGGYTGDWLTDPKVVATAALWIMLAVFVHLRASADRHGRGVALIALGGLACLLFAFIGVPIIAVTAHPFVQSNAGMFGP